MLSKWNARDGAVEQLQGESGLLVCWRVAGPLSAAAADKLREELLALSPAATLAPVQWQTQLAASPDARVSLPGKVPGVWLATADFLAADGGAVQFLASASGKYQVWLNGRSLYRREEPRSFQPDADRFEAALAAGRNRVVFKIEMADGAALLQARFRRRSSQAELETLVQAALKSKGDASRGREVFLSAKAQCSKCHRVGDTGERIGPELTGIGGRLARVQIVESILEPSRSVTPGFQTYTVRLLDGRVLSGVQAAETETAITLADQQGQKHVLARSEIDVQQPQTKSTMPDNFAQQLTPEQFVDLVVFLAGQREPPGR